MTSQHMHLWMGEGQGGSEERWEQGRGLSSKLACLEAASAQPCFPQRTPQNSVLLIIRGASELSSPDCHVENVSPRWSGGYIFSKQLGDSANFCMEWKR